jgi:hypothetical protein
MVLSGMAKMAPAFHSKVTLAPASFHTMVEPRPSSTYTISSKSWRRGASCLPAGISQTYASFEVREASWLRNTPRPPRLGQSRSSSVCRFCW